MVDAERVVLPLLRQLLVFARKWSRGLPLDVEAVARVRNTALMSNFRHHLRQIPMFARVAREEDVEDGDPFELVRDRVLVSDDWFKSYDREWLHGDFASLSAWLENAAAVRLPTVSSRVTDLSSWRSELGSNGVFVTISSGTSTGQPSLVPRDELTLAALRSSSGVRFPWCMDAGEYDCLLLTPVGMDSGLQAGAAGIAAGARGVHRLGVPGVVGFLRDAVAGRRKVVVFGPPSGLSSLVEELAQTSARVALPAGSCVVTGGGWKKRGPSPDLDVLLDTASTVLGLDRRRCVDAYSTAELNTVFVSCVHHRYHVPPVVEAVLVDDLLRPLASEGAGRLAVFDPFARSYPSVATSDQVILGADPCACGLAGQTLLAPITRLEDAPPRGCGILGADGTGSR